MLAAQDGKCAICLTASAAHIDHDHATGKVRGMLCFRCNAALASGHDRSAAELHWARRLAEAEYGSAS